MKLLLQSCLHLMPLTTPEIAIPCSLGCYVPMIYEGIEVFLAGISYRRMRRVLLSQFSHRETSELAGHSLIPCFNRY